MLSWYSTSYLPVTVVTPGLENLKIIQGQLAPPYDIDQYSLFSETNFEYSRDVLVLLLLLVLVQAAKISVQGKSSVAWDTNGVRCS